MRRTTTFFVLLFTAACGVYEPPAQKTTSQSIIGGAQSSSHPGSVALIARYMGQTDAFCSGTVIAKRHILTAAHCIVESGLPTSVMKVFFGTRVSPADGPMIQVTRATTHSGFNSRTLDNDVAVIEIADDAPVAPVPLIPIQLGSDQIGQALTLVGFGVNNAANQTGEGIKRLIELPLQQLDSSHLYYSDRTKGTCQGDSGGSSYMTLDEIESVVGITDFGSQDCVSMGADTRVDHQRDWILSHLPEDGDGPSIDVQSPGDSEVVEASFTVEGAATDDSGVIDVVIEEDGNRLGRTHDGSFSFDLELPPGAHTLTIRATDTRWNTSEQTLAIQVACTTNAQCGGGKLCVQSRCIAAPAIGGGCGSDADCSGGKCVAGFGPNASKVCSRGCQQNADCPNAYACSGGVCAPRLSIAPGEVGAPCAANDQCAGGACVGADSGRGYCTASCDAQNACPNNAVCGAAPASSDQCGPPVAPSVGGCSTAGDEAGAMASFWGALLLGALLFTSRRRPARR